MNLKELRAEINKDIDDQLNNADINGWINRALDDLSVFARYKKKITIDLKSGQSDYQLPTDLIDIVMVGNNLPGLPLNDFNRTGYKVIGDTLSLQPTPSNDDTMTLIYTATLPHVSNDDDVPAIPENFHNLLILYAVSKFKYSDEELQFVYNSSNDYEARKSEFIRYVNRKEATTRIRDVYRWQNC